MKPKLLKSERNFYISSILLKSIKKADHQGRIQDLSEGGARFIWEQKNPDLRTKGRAAGKNFFFT